MPRRRSYTPRPVHKVVYWDAVVWIAWLNKEKRKPGDMEGVITAVEHVMAGRSTLVVSRFLTDVEVPIDRFSKESRALFDRTIKRSNVIRVDYEPPIMALSKDLVRFYRKEHRAGRVNAELDPWDAIHLATALRIGVEAFYTFDEGGHGGLSLLGLGNVVGGHPLTVCKPPYEQVPLIFD